MIDFPASPTVGQTFTSAGVTWTWDGTKWGVGAPPPIYVPLAGGTMTGDLILNRDPVIALGAATKQYADTHIIGDNRIINGDMRINQRGVASGTAVGYFVDRWQFAATLTTKGTWSQAGGSTSPGFPYCLGFVSNSAYTLLAADYFIFGQAIEADMISDFAWGTSNAQPVTLSFWAYSSLGGTFGGVLKNYASTRSYPFTYTLPAAAWTRIVVNIPGDTGGTWVMSSNAGSLYVWFSFGTGTTYSGPAGSWSSGNYLSANGAVSVVSTNGASFYLTGVKLEVGTVATPFNRQTTAKSMADCQRYFNAFGNYILASGYGAVGTAYCSLSIPTMRIAPSAVYSNLSYSNAANLGYNSSTTSLLTSGVSVTVAGYFYAIGLASLTSEL